MATTDQDVFLESVALNLHGFYSGLERVFVQIARRIDQDVPTDNAWHVTLLTQMETEAPNVRPAILSRQSHHALDELRRFRHLVRNVYTHNLVAGKMQAMIELLPQTWAAVKSELIAFAEVLDRLAELLEEE